MTWFSKPKELFAEPGALCSRCRERPGTIRLGTELVASGETGRSMWLCDACARELRNDVETS